MTPHPATLNFEVKDRVARITLNRPEAANAFNVTMATELASVARQCDANPDVRAVLLTGAGRFFSVGGDIKAMAAAGANIAVEVKRMADELHRAISILHRMKAPLVVAINGPCAGAGFSLALAGDVVVATASARFSMAYAQVGLSPDGSSTYFLPRLVGLRRAQELILTNRTLTAQEACDWGLLTSVTGDADLSATASAIASSLAGGSVSAHGAAKELLASTFARALETQMELEGRQIAAAACSVDGQEGIRAFIERRSPRFS